MDLDTIKQLMEAMEESGTTRVSLTKENGFAIELERSPDFHIKSYLEKHSQALQQEPQADLEEKNQILKEQKQQQIQRAEASEHEIQSPMVGTFYACASPDEPPFVQVGDVVKEDTVVCIIEAMKVMNEVKAGKSGKIAEVYIDNAHPVEFGTKLFRIEG